MQASSTDEAQKILSALLPSIKAHVEGWMKTAIRSKRYMVSTPPDGEKVGVREAYGDEVFLPYISSLAGMQIHDAVWVEWKMNDFSTAIVTSFGNGDVPQSEVDYPIEIAKGGTGATTAAQARSNLGIQSAVAEMMAVKLSENYYTTAGTTIVTIRNFTAVTTVGGFSVDTRGVKVGSGIRGVLVTASAQVQSATGTASQQNKPYLCITKNAASTITSSNPIYGMASIRNIADSSGIFAPESLVATAIVPVLENDVINMGIRDEGTRPATVFGGEGTMINVIKLY